MNLVLRPTLARLADLESELASNPVHELPPYALTAEPWRGAGVFVTDDAFELAGEDSARHGDLGVLTRHVRPLSWLFFALRDLPPVPPRAHEARAFFGRLADAANGFLAAHQPEGDDWRPLLLAVVREARRAMGEPSGVLPHQTPFHAPPRRARRPVGPWVVGVAAAA